MTKAPFILVFVLASTVAFAQKAQVTSAYMYLKNGELASAREAIDKAAADESTKDNPKTWVYRGNVYKAIAADKNHEVNVPNAWEEAQRSYEKAAELDTKKDYKTEIIAGLDTIAIVKFNQGVTPYNAQQYDKAYDAFKSVSDIYALLNKTYSLGIVDTSAMTYAAYAAVHSNKYTEAMEYYNKLIQLNVKKPELYKGLETVALAQKDTAAALKYIAQGRTAFPDNNMLMLDELNIYLAQNKTQQVLDKLKDAIAKNPTSAELNYVLGNKYDLALGDTTTALKYYNDAIRIKPDYFSAYYSSGAMFFNQAVKVNDEMNKLSLSAADQKKYDQLKALRDRLFRRALPFMEQAYTLSKVDVSKLDRDEVRDTYTALKKMYALTNQTDKMNQVGKDLDALGK